MKQTKNSSGIQQQTNPLLLKAQGVLASYTRATGTMVGIMDHNHEPIPEIRDDVIIEKNICLFCIKCRLNFTVNKTQDFELHPCRDMHIGEMKKAEFTGGTGCFTCDLGFTFWTNPVFSEKQLIGSVIGGGFLSIDKEEAAERMENMYKGAINRHELEKHFSFFHKTDAEHIDALSELMLACAESISHNNADYYATLRRRDEQQKKLMAMTEQLGKKYGTGSLPEYPLEKEHAFLHAVRRGDIKKGLQHLNELLSILLFTYPKEFKNIQLRILELALLLSRVDNVTGSVSKTFSHSIHLFLKSIEQAEHSEELIDCIHLMTVYLAEESFSFQGTRHGPALKKADHYIQDNFTRKLSLEEIAAAADLSPPYFSTIFKEEMGESLSSYLNRLRVEKAAHLLAETNVSLSEITNSCGFGDQSWFSKIFKIYTGMKPKEYRQNKKARYVKYPESRYSQEYLALVNK